MRKRDLLEAIETLLAVADDRDSYGTHRSRSYDDRRKAMAEAARLRRVADYMRTLVNPR